jgi:hypothetical protein
LFVRCGLVAAGESRCRHAVHSNDDTTAKGLALTLSTLQTDTAGNDAASLVRATRSYVMPFDGWGVALFELVTSG